MLVRVEGLSKDFGATQALRNASFTLVAGEIHALVGENGSGKSTLVKILSGVHVPDAGTLEFGGSASSFAGSPRIALRHGIATVFQEILVAEARPVLDNIWLGTDGLVRRRVTAREKRRRARDLLGELLGYELDLDRPVEQLPLSERQACCIARAMLRRPSVLILDEATSALDIAVRDRVFVMLRALAAEGVGVIFITHRMDELSQIVNRLTVMRSGETVATLAEGEWDPDTLVRLMTGSDAFTGAVHREAGSAQARRGDVVLRATEVQLRPGSRPFDIEVHAGEIIGLAGLEGHGQEECLEALRGSRAIAATVSRHDGGRDEPIRSFADAARLGVVYVPRERRHAVFEWMSIRENFAMPTLSHDTRLGWLRRGAMRSRFADYAKRVNLVFGHEDDRITTLSGGNQQKVVIARWLAADPRVLVLNDPTRGIDIGAKRDLYRLLTELAEAGLAVVMLSTEIDEHLELMDRVLVFREHELGAEIAHHDLTRHALVTAFFDDERREAGETAPSYSEAPAQPVARGRHARAAFRLLTRYSFAPALALSVALLVINLLTESGGFGLTAQLANLAPLALAALASTPSILSGDGGLDISISPVMILISAIFVVWLAPHALGGAVAVPILLAAGAAVGLINGLLVMVSRMQPVVVTLSMYFILIGVLLEVVPATASVNTTWMTSLAGSVGPIPGALFTIGAPLLIWAGLGCLPYRRALYAVGSNAATAYASGVNVTAVRLIAYSLGGLFAAVGGIAVVALELSAGSGLATTYTLLAIASVALGGTSLWGGRGGLIGSIFGAATIYLLGNVLQALQVDPQWLQVVYGLALLAAVVAGGLSTRVRTA